MVPAKVMWYAPIIPRLKHLFRNKEHARLLRWHKEYHKKDAMLRHPVMGRSGEKSRETTRTLQATQGT
jgi:mannose/fructose/N-acetylgalactosamine-specific phosphotransferase system component IID